MKDTLVPSYDMATFLIAGEGWASLEGPWSATAHCHLDAYGEGCFLWYLHRPRETVTTSTKGSTCDAVSVTAKKTLNPEPQPLQVFDGVDPLAVDLLSLMLEYDPARRVSARKALRHPYFDSIRQRMARMAARKAPAAAKRAAGAEGHRQAGSGDVLDGQSAAALHPKRRH
jgi:hypothetical protein